MGFWEDISDLLVKEAKSRVSGGKAVAENAKEGLTKAGERARKANEWMPGQDTSGLVQDVLDTGGALPLGIFRELGLLRQSGGLTPQMHARAVMEQPNYPRYKQLTEWMVRKKQGDTFPVYRGEKYTGSGADPIFQPGSTPATGVSRNAGTAHAFSAGNLDPAGVVELGITPEDVISLLPTRKSSYAHEAEMIVDPRRAHYMKPVGEHTPGKTGGHTPSPLMEDVVNSVIASLTGKPAPFPGGGIKLSPYGEDQMLSKLSKARSNVEQQKSYAKSLSQYAKGTGELKTKPPVGPPPEGFPPAESWYAPWSGGSKTPASQFHKSWATNIDGFSPELISKLAQKKIIDPQEVPGIVSHMKNKDKATLLESYFGSWKNEPATKANTSKLPDQLGTNSDTLNTYIENLWDKVKP